MRIKKQGKTIKITATLNGLKKEVYYNGYTLSEAMHDFLNTK